MYRLGFGWDMDNADRIGTWRSGAILPIAEGASEFAIARIDPFVPQYLPNP